MGWGSANTAKIKCSGDDHAELNLGLKVKEGLCKHACIVEFSEGIVKRGISQLGLLSSSSYTRFEMIPQWLDE